MKFHAKDLISELDNTMGSIELEVVGRANLNEWGGRITPQLFIDDYEIYICGPNPVKPGIDALDEDYRNLIILTPEQVARGQVIRAIDQVPGAMELYNKAWDRIKATDAK